MFNFYTLKASPFFVFYFDHGARCLCLEFFLFLFIIGSSLFTFFKLVFSNLEFSTFQARTNHIIIHSMILFFLNTYFGGFFSFHNNFWFFSQLRKRFLFGVWTFWGNFKTYILFVASCYEKTWFTYRIWFKGKKWSSYRSPNLLFKQSHITSFINRKVETTKVKKN